MYRKNDQPRPPSSTSTNTTKSSTSSSSSSLTLSSALTGSSSINSDNSSSSTFHCDYNGLPKSGFNRVKCHCPTVYRDHLTQSCQNEDILGTSANSTMIMQTSSPMDIIPKKTKELLNSITDNQQYIGDKKMTNTNRWHWCCCLNCLVETRDHKRGKQQLTFPTKSNNDDNDGIVKLVGSFLIGILFLSLVVVAVFIRHNETSLTTTGNRNTNAVKHPPNNNDPLLLLASSASSSNDANNSTTSITNNNNRQFNGPQHEYSLPIHIENSRQQQRDSTLQRKFVGQINKHSRLSWILIKEPNLESKHGPNKLTIGHETSTQLTDDLIDGPQYDGR